MSFGFSSKRQIRIVFSFVSILGCLEFFPTASEARSSEIPKRIEGYELFHDGAKNFAGPERESLLRTEGRRRISDLLEKHPEMINALLFDRVNAMYESVGSKSSFFTAERLFEASVEIAGTYSIPISTGVANRIFKALYGLFEEQPDLFRNHGESLVEFAGTHATTRSAERLVCEALLGRDERTRGLEMRALRSLHFTRVHQGNRRVYKAVYEFFKTRNESVPALGTLAIIDLERSRPLLSKAILRTRDTRKFSKLAGYISPLRDFELTRLLLSQGKSLDPATQRPGVDRYTGIYDSALVEFARKSEGDDLAMALDAMRARGSLNLGQDILRERLSSSSNIQTVRVLLRLISVETGQGRFIHKDMLRAVESAEHRFGDDLEVKESGRAAKSNLRKALGYE